MAPSLAQAEGVDAETVDPHLAAKSRGSGGFREK